VRCVVAPRNENPQTARGCGCAAGGAETTCLRRSSRFKVDAFSFAEIVVVVAILAVLLTFVLVGVARARASARSAQCVNNLRQIGQAFQSYAVSNAGRLPDPTSLETTWESLLRPYLPSVDAFRCPADGEVFASLNSSYDWRDGGEPETSAAGRPLAACRADAVLAFDVFPRWHGARSMNAVRVDGSALSMDEQECLRDLLREVTTGGTGNDGH
jgi:type II secretory pathway pseudopilin PulG